MLSTPAMPSSLSCMSTLGSSASSWATRTRWVLPGPGGCPVAAHPPSTLCLPRSLPWPWMGAVHCWRQLRHSPPAWCGSGTSRPGDACPCSRAQYMPSAPSGGHQAVHRGWGGWLPRRCSPPLPIHSFSGSGALLYGVGKDGHGRTVLSPAWGGGQPRQVPRSCAS